MTAIAKQPMTKGQALYETRLLFGSRGFVRRIEGPPVLCAVGVFDQNGWVPLAGAETWELALAYAEEARTLRGGC